MIDSAKAKSLIVPSRGRVVLVRYILPMLTLAMLFLFNIIMFAFIANNVPFVSNTLYLPIVALTFGSVVCAWALLGSFAIVWMTAGIGRLDSELRLTEIDEFPNGEIHVRFADPAAFILALPRNRAQKRRAVILDVLTTIHRTACMTESVGKTKTFVFTTDAINDATARRFGLKRTRLHPVSALQRLFGWVPARILRAITGGKGYHYRRWTISSADVLRSDHIRRVLRDLSN